jgi:hypothetical protein
MAKAITKKFPWVEDVLLNTNELQPNQIKIVVIHSYPETTMIIGAVQAIVNMCMPGDIPWVIEYRQVINEDNKNPPLN